MRIDPRGPKSTKQQTEKPTQNTPKTGPEPNTTKTSQPPFAVMGATRAHH
jgi:hypothetical protein